LCHEAIIELYQDIGDDEWHPDFYFCCGQPGEVHPICALMIPDVHLDDGNHEWQPVLCFRNSDNRNHDWQRVFYHDWQRVFCHDQQRVFYRRVHTSIQWDYDNQDWQRFQFSDSRHQHKRRYQFQFREGPCQNSCAL